MKKLFKYLKPHMFFSILAPLLMLVEVSCELMLPKIMSNIVNIGIANNNINYITTQGLFMLIFSLIGVVGGVGCTIFAAKASQFFGSDVRFALFKKIQSFSFVNLDKFHTSSLVTRLTNDITQIQQIVLMSLRMLVRAPLTFLGGLIMVYSLNSNLTKILFISVFFLIILLYAILKAGFPLFKIAQQKIDRVNTVMRENLSGVRVVKAFVREDLEKKKFKKSNEDLRDTTIKAFKTITLIMPAMMLIMNITTVLILWFGGIKVNTGTMQSGDLMAYINYLTQILMSLMMVGMIVLMISRGKASIDRINEVLDTELDITNPIFPVENCIKYGNIEFKNVSFSYPESTGDMVLKNINFKAEQGQTIGILGQTGAGKSTFVNLIPRLYDVTDGEILIDGINVKNMNLDYLRKSIGIVLQRAVLFSGTIKENLKWGNEKATDNDIINASKNAQAYNFIMELPDKFDTILGQMGVNLSGGQKQRISIARTLMKNPKILIFDDSTSAVDMTTEANIQKSIKKNMPDTTKIIIAQKISSIMYADKIIIIQGGEIAGEGTHEQLLKANEIYKDIYNSQIKKEEVL